MFGKKEDNEIAEVKTGPLNTFYVDGITAKRKKTNEINPSHDIIVVIHTDANEEEFRKLLDEFVAENEDFYKDVYMVKFSVYLSKNGFYCFCQNSYYNRYFPYQKL